MLYVIRVNDMQVFEWHIPIKSSSKLYNFLDEILVPSQDAWWSWVLGSYGGKTKPRLPIAINQSMNRINSLNLSNSINAVIFFLYLLKLPCVEYGSYAHVHGVPCCKSFIHLHFPVYWSPVCLQNVVVCMISLLLGLALDDGAKWPSFVCMTTIFELF